MIGRCGSGASTRRGFLGALATAGAGVAFAANGAGTSPDDAGSAGLVFSRRLPVKVETDVFVAGGGPSGIAAAVTAAKAGARVFLSEAHTSFGGMSTIGRIPLSMKWSDGIRDMDAGFGARIRRRLEVESHLKGPATDIEALKRVYDREAESAGVDFAFYSRVIGVDVRGGHVDHAVVSSPSGLWAVKAKVFVDATGNGDLCMFAGAETRTGDADGKSMPGTLCTLWAGCDFSKWPKSRTREQHRALDRAIRDGVFSEPDNNWCGIWDVGEGVANGNLGHAFEVDGTDERSLTRAMVDGRRKAMEYERYLREYLKEGFENARVVSTAEVLGVRASRRVVGDYVLTFEDYLRRASFEDEIGRYLYTIDIHPGTNDRATVEAYRHRAGSSIAYGAGDSYGIPLRTLVPRALGNVLVAGRCISTDHYMQGSVRVTPGCHITGQAAGMVAAMSVAADGDVRKIRAADVRRRLRAIGAYAPDPA